MQPIVSVIINAFNYGQFIEQAVDSALYQTYPSHKIEVIVVDDGSTDDTAEKMARYKNKIKYIYKPNGGQASALNAGIEAANGKYLFLLDADDMFKPNKVERIVAEFETYPEVVMVFDAREVVMADRTVLEKKPERHNIGISHSGARAVMECGYGTSRTALRKSSLPFVLPIPEVLRIEADLYLLALLWKGNISCLSDHLTTYRVHSDNHFHTSSPAKLPLKINSIRSAVQEAQKTIKKAPTFKQQDADNVFMPYLIELKELEFNLNLQKQRATRLELFALECKKISFLWPSWRLRYKLFKLLLLPLTLLFSPNITQRMRLWYSEQNIWRIRSIFFPE